jgi:hypothetical protein
LKWKVIIPEIEIVNPLYNVKTRESQKIKTERDKNEEVRKDLIFSLQGLTKYKRNFEQDCAETKLYINSIINNPLTGVE